MNIMEERKLGFGCVRMPVLQDGKQDSFDYSKLRNCSIHFWSTVLRILTRGIHIKRITGNFSSQQFYYNNFTMNSHGKAENCIKCG